MIELAQQLGHSTRPARRRLSRDQASDLLPRASACRSKSRCSRRSRSTAGIAATRRSSSSRSSRATCASCARRRTVRLIQLVSDRGAWSTDDGLQADRRLRGRHRTGEIAGPAGGGGRLARPRRPTSWRALTRPGLLVHVWTIRVDKEFLPAGYNGDAAPSSCSSVSSASTACSPTSRMLR